MFRSALTVAYRSSNICGRALPLSVTRTCAPALKNVAFQPRTFKTLTHPQISIETLSFGLKSLQLTSPAACTVSPIGHQQTRTVTKFSMKKGKRKTVRTALKRFKRLHWGGWIRTRCGRHKKMHRKKSNRRRRLRQHVLVNSTQAFLLDKMVTNFWKRPRYYIEDDYEPYHTRSHKYAACKPVPMQERVN